VALQIDQLRARVAGHVLPPIGSWVRVHNAHDPAFRAHNPPMFGTASTDLRLETTSSTTRQADACFTDP
jgi:hypothetical protein